MRVTLWLTAMNVF
jgi:hypothetical protein